jgi:hypothetical protein
MAGTTTTEMQVIDDVLSAESDVDGLLDEQLTAGQDECRADRRRRSALPHRGRQAARRRPESPRPVRTVAHTECCGVSTSRLRRPSSIRRAWRRGSSSRSATPSRCGLARRHRRVVAGFAATLRGARLIGINQRRDVPFSMPSAPGPEQRRGPAPGPWSRRGIAHGRGASAQTADHVVERGQRLVIGM